MLALMAPGKDGGTAHPLQSLALAYAGNTREMQDWSFNKPGATISPEAMTKAAARLQKWAKLPEGPADDDHARAWQLSTV